tara:strand:- start:321 stop:473 length:153 start_codon:yes stop_codon:yes gene_type:complete
MLIVTGYPDPMDGTSKNVSKPPKPSKRNLKAGDTKNPAVTGWVSKSLSIK